MVKVHQDGSDLISFEIDRDMQALFKAISWYSDWKGNPRLRPGERLWVAKHAPLVPYVGLYAGHSIPIIGPFSYTSSAMQCLNRLGAYCSISWNLRVMGNNHMMEQFSTTGGLYGEHAIFRDAYAAVRKKPDYRPNPQKPVPVFGNDVWVGQDVLLARGISIGDGAVVAGGSVVTRDVAPYAIVGGAPARLIRQRFAKEEQELLQASRWWEYMLPDLAPLATGRIEAFVTTLDRAKADGSARKIPSYGITFAELLRGDRIAVFLDELAAAKQSA